MGADGTKSTRGSSEWHCSDAAPLDASHHAQHPTACPQNGLGGRLASSLLLKDRSARGPRTGCCSPSRCCTEPPQHVCVSGFKTHKNPTHCTGPPGKGRSQTDTTGPRQEHRAQVSGHRPGLPHTGPTPEPADSPKPLCLNPTGSKPQSLSGWLNFFFFCCALVG